MTFRFRAVALVACTWILLFNLPSDAGVVTGVYANGVYLPSDGQNLAFGLPTNLLISGNNGSFLFNFNLVTDLSQNPDEFSIGDSLSVRFFQDNMDPMGMPEDFDSQVYYLTNTSGIQTIVFERAFTTLGIFEGGMTVRMNNSISSYGSPFLPGGYESDPIFHFRLVVDQLVQQSSAASLMTPILENANYKSTDYFSGNLSDPQSESGVPEPTSFVFLSSGLAMLYSVHKRVRS